MLLNFLSNSLKFTSHGSVVVKLVVDGVHYSHASELSARKTPYLSFQIQICDTGVGISEEGLKKLFMNFSCLKEHIGGNSRGTGLGLSISKKILCKMGGTVDVKSQVGQGTTFTISMTTKCKGLDHPSPPMRRVSSLIPFDGPGSRAD